MKERAKYEQLAYERGKSTADTIEERFSEVERLKNTEIKVRFFFIVFPFDCSFLTYVIEKALEKSLKEAQAAAKEAFEKGHEEGYSKGIEKGTELGKSSTPASYGIFFQMFLVNYQLFFH